MASQQHSSGNRKKYRPGFNSKGLPSKQYEDTPSVTERGKRRKK